MKDAWKLPVMAGVLAIGMTGSSLILSNFFVKVRQEQAITVKGYAEQDVISDVGKFSCTFSASGASLKEAFLALQHSRNAVLDYLRQAGFKDADLAPGTIETSRVMKLDAQGQATNDIEYHNAYQQVVVSSNHVELIRTTATQITDLIQHGVDIRASSPEFYVSDLKDTKLTLLTAATQDGYRRATTLAAHSGGRVGSLISAQQGVFQITERHSTDTSSYGEYNTATIHKTAKAVVTLQYSIQSQ